MITNQEVVTDELVILHQKVNYSKRRQSCHYIAELNPFRSDIANRKTI